LALARESEGVAFVPGRAAYMDGRSGSSSMRLNFAGVCEEDIREGMRRIGKVVREQLSLFGTLSGSAPGVRAQAGRAAGGGASTPGTAAASAGPADEVGATPPGAGAEEETDLADVVALPRRAAEGSARRRRDR